ncbi:MAG: hypothetical protein GY870_09905, partial [archaeon]|nr:hypothetical protein [archaeon]
EKPLLFDEEFNLLPSITKTMQMSKYGQNISNIIDVLPNSEKYNMNDFIGLNVVLFEEKDSENPQRAKNGYLIGISKDNKAYIIGLWPYSFYQQIKGKFRDCIDKLKKIINNPANIEELLLLSQK